MSFQCDNCGSRNHSKFDCIKPYNGWREREPAKALEWPSASVEVDQVAEIVEKVQPDKPKTAVELSGLSPSLPTRKSFPFLRDTTRQQMDERAEKAKSAKVVAGDLPKQNLPERSAPVALPKAAKKQARQEELL